MLYNSEMQFFINYIWEKSIVSESALATYPALTLPEDSLILQEFSQ